LTDGNGPRAVNDPLSIPSDSVSMIQKSREQAGAGNRWLFAALVVVFLISVLRWKVSASQRFLTGSVRFLMPPHLPCCPVVPATPKLNSFGIVRSNAELHHMHEAAVTATQFVALHYREHPSGPLTVLRFFFRVSCHKIKIEQASQGNTYPPCVSSLFREPVTAGRCPSLAAFGITMMGLLRVLWLWRAKRFSKRFVRASQLSRFPLYRMRHRVTQRQLLLAFGNKQDMPNSRWSEPHPAECCLFWFS